MDQFSGEGSEHWTRIDAARLLAYRALSMADAGTTSMRETAMAKCFGITSEQAAITECQQLQGADGYLTDLPFEQRVRDAAALSFTGGTVNVMKILLGRELIGRDFAGL